MLVADPPAVPSADPVGSPSLASHVVESSGPNQTLMGRGGSDTFVFKMGFGDASVANFELGTDRIEVDKSLFASPEVLLAATHDDGHGSAVIVADQNDTITLKNVALSEFAQHLADFHLI